MVVPAPCARAESHYIIARLGLSPGVGDGTGTWLLEARTDAQAAPDIEVRAFARSALFPRPDERRRALRPVPGAHSSGGGGTVSTTVV